MSKINKDSNVPNTDTINREDAIDAVKRVMSDSISITRNDWRAIIAALKELPSSQIEPLTDKEQRIFLAAMRREEKVCEEVDRNYIREPYEDSLIRVCNEIRRKVKGALWT